MKVLLLICLFVGALCDDLHFYHFAQGNLVHGKEKLDSTGLIFIEFVNKANFTIVGGMAKHGKTLTPFSMLGKITSFNNSTSIHIEGECNMISWGAGGRFIRSTGVVKVIGTWDSINYESKCKPQTGNEISFKASAKETKCPYYPPKDGAMKAKELIGQNARLYRPHHVVSYAILGYPYFGRVRNCTHYLRLFKNVTDPKPGFIIIGNNGSHCGIVDNEGHKFIHSDPGKKKVVMTPIALAKNFFKEGYFFKDYTC